VIIATMTELTQRMLTNRPTVALISETGILPVASSPTLAREPRTEITRPNDVTVVPARYVVNSCLCMTMQASIGETVKFGNARVPQICGILVRIAIYPLSRVVHHDRFLQENGCFAVHPSMPAARPA
jgi:hypothetical protein